MAVIKRMSSKARVRKVEKYLTAENKTEEKLITGINCDSRNFWKQCEQTNLFYHKNQEQDERKYYHIVQSFSPLDNGVLSHDKAHQIGVEFAEKNFKGFEVLVVTHKDKEHIHNHFVINSVNFETGLKYRADNKSLWNMRRTSNRQCQANGLENSIQPLDKRNKGKMKSGELRLLVKGQKPWKEELKDCIKKCCEYAENEKQFVELMAEKFGWKVTTRMRTSKGVKKEIYQYQRDGMEKPCGEFRLGDFKEYEKENIHGTFRTGKEEQRESNSTGTDLERRGQEAIERVYRSVGNSTGREGSGEYQSRPTGSRIEEITARNTILENEQFLADRAIRENEKVLADHGQRRTDLARDRQGEGTERNTEKGTHTKGKNIDRER